MAKSKGINGYWEKSRFCDLPIHLIYEKQAISLTVEQGRCSPLIQRRSTHSTF